MTKAMEFISFIGLNFLAFDVLFFSAYSWYLRVDVKGLVCRIDDHTGFGAGRLLDVFNQGVVHWHLG